jgi:hypothetical protein
MWYIDNMVNDGSLDLRRIRPAAALDTAPLPENNRASRLIQ